MHSPVGALAAGVAVVHGVAPLARLELPAWVPPARSAGATTLASASGATTAIDAAVTAVISAAGLARATPQKLPQRTPMALVEAAALHFLRPGNEPCCPRAKLEFLAYRGAPCIVTVRGGGVSVRLSAIAHVVVVRWRPSGA